MGAGDPALHAEPAHDVLAAEEFPLGAGDPALHAEPAHDVLAAEEFPLGAGDPALRHGPIVLPEDLTGSPEPRDVLVAEEFPMPAQAPHRSRAGGVHSDRADSGPGASDRAGRARLVHGVLVAAALIGLLLAVSRRRRRAG